MVPHPESGAGISSVPAIDVDLVRQLLAEQFPQWADLPIRPVEPGGWDNRTFRLGDRMSVRLPSAPHYARQVAKEQLWLPRLAPQLPLSVPTPLARGIPGAGYPFSWSIYRWLEGETARRDNITDMTAFATALADFLNALRRIDPTGGPEPGPHNFWRGGPLAHYDGETRAALERLVGQVDTAAALDLWEDALSSTWQERPVWLHGDVAQGNLLVRSGKLAAVIDFGTSGIGDPACDLVIAWKLFERESREVFRRALALDPDTWTRGRGWTLWKALILCAGMAGTIDPADIEDSRRVIDVLIDEHRQRFTVGK
ncbi:MAG TPA: aminoglycoside phosphotransferase family protein [Candidatus Binatia bacterium]|nr:aminoglycoside phosphotransferase family protein [Candidatus Binatia bacterium]